MSITMIAAMDRNRTIGFGNRLPWKLPAEMAYFKRNTIGKTIIMGRKTFESFRSKPLPNRRNVVLTRQENASFEGCETVGSVQEAIERFGGEDLMIIGGEEIYAQFLPFADKLLLTEVHTSVPEGDAYFPVFSMEEWTLVHQEPVASDEANAYPFTFQTFTRSGQTGL
ncbi:dihydrofolate reductase [Paenibacillus radicis (ex Gao et al. 2016)]|uniref:Dihydrofolate reductase n=1 Tax=Paenibacillus radicis (ex Gao et al. 2016) TaxID=1737354 RepID=A0A917HSR3_9BACL|nr:dihydrofolate reductase [Paenibacillus radicis (ex Gao et al. 2016)]GGG88289.1 dihydrofolate reductase [Paenibacillus radicis (ex Gao et al. 2016)]